MNRACCSICIVRTMLAVFLSLPLSGFAEDSNFRPANRSDMETRTVDLEDHAEKTLHIDTQEGKSDSRKNKNKFAPWVSESDEILFGNYVDAEITGQFIVSENSGMIAAVTEIGQKVAAASDRPALPYKFKVLTSPDINAFAGPGGYVYITTGLLGILESKDEVAAVLAHEIGHIGERHQLRTLQNATNTQAIGTVLSLAATVAVAAVTYDSNTGTCNTDLSNAAGCATFMAAIMVHQGYSRVYELKADELSVTYLRRAGYDPQGARDVLSKFKEVEKKNNNNREIQCTLLSTHPSTKERIEKVGKLIAVS